MAEFFREDFTQEKWKKAALKNAFVLMSRQRYHHAAAFFLLGDSLKDAIQVLLNYFLKTIGNNLFLDNSFSTK